MSKSEDERRARLAAALKQNIARRKAQDRARSSGSAPDDAAKSSRPPSVGGADDQKTKPKANQ
jgi:hypothetical protein